MGITKKPVRKPVSVRFNSRERAIIKARAEAEGLGQGEYLRRLIVPQLEGDAAKLDGIERAASAGVLAAQLGCQVWAHLHIMRRPSPVEETQIEELYQQLVQQYLLPEKEEGNGN